MEMVRLNAGGVKIKNPAASAEHHEGLPRITLEEIRSQAQKCIDESRKTQANPKLSAAWAIDFTIAKAKQMIDMQGDRIFVRSRRCRAGAQQPTMTALCR
jgi:hypothetical protein